jgi:alkylated DNA repair dioxygenase AlkB
MLRGLEPLQGSLLAAGWADPALANMPSFARKQLDEQCWVDLARGWLHGADTLLALLVEDVPWHQGRRRMYDRVVDDPRLSHWWHRGDEELHPVLAAARTALESRFRVELQGPGLNYYRSGADSVAPHADRELRDVDDTIVAILTLGARRPFLVRPKRGGPSIDLGPGSGDLLVMGGAMQRDWEHAVPKVRHAGPRISASWRATRCVQGTSVGDQPDATTSVGFPEPSAGTR